jgi:hypothetical protein
MMAETRAGIIFPLDAKGQEYGHDRCPCGFGLYQFKRNSKRISAEFKLCVGRGELPKGVGQDDWTER